MRSSRRRVGYVAERNRHDHAVERLPGTRPAQQIEEGVPACTIDRCIRILGGVAAGGIDQHGILGEPPVAEPRAADAGHRALSHLGSQRKFQPAVQQRRRLAGARRPDDGVPRLLVEIAPLAARALQQRKRRGHPLPKRRRLFARSVIRALGGTLGDAAFQPLLATSAIKVEQQVRRAPHQQQDHHDDQSRQPCFEILEEGAEEPDQQRQDGDADETQYPTGRQEPRTPA